MGVDNVGLELIEAPTHPQHTIDVIHATYPERTARKTLRSEIVGNVHGHDIHETYLFDNANKDVTLGTYNPSTVLRVEHGVGHIENPSDELIAVNLSNISKEGFVNITPTGMQERMTHVLSSRIYDYDAKTHTIKILQYRLPDEMQHTKFYQHSSWTGPGVEKAFQEHTNGQVQDPSTTWSGKKEVETILMARWTPEGVVIFPGLIGGNLMKEEIQQAKTRLADSEKTNELQQYFIHARKALHQQQVRALKSEFVAYNTAGSMNKN